MLSDMEIYLELQKSQGHRWVNGEASKAHRRARERDLNVSRTPGPQMSGRGERLMLTHRGVHASPRVQDVEPRCVGRVHRVERRKGVVDEHFDHVLDERSS